MGNLRGRLAEHGSSKVPAQPVTTHVFDLALPRLANAIGGIGIVLVLARLKPASGTNAMVAFANNDGGIVGVVLFFDFVDAPERIGKPAHREDKKQMRKH